MTVKVSSELRCSVGKCRSVFPMEQVTAASLPAPDQDGGSGGRPWERDGALDNGTSPGHAPPSFPACTETFRGFGNRRLRGDSRSFFLGLAVALPARRREPVRHRRRLGRAPALGSAGNPRSACGTGQRAPFSTRSRQERAAQCRLCQPWLCPEGRRSLPRQKRCISYGTGDSKQHC